MDLMQKIVIWAIPVLFAITVHEASHGYAARALGDKTAESQGRLSLNPIRHIDPVGTLLVPAVLLALGGFLFGWAKPVPVNPYRFAHPRRDMALVAVAGPLSNFGMATFWALLLKFSVVSASGAQSWQMLLSQMAAAGIVINLILMVLNLIPLPPLDGGRVLTGVVPEAVAQKLDRLERFGLLILLVLLMTGVLGTVLQPVLVWSQSVLLHALGVPVSLF